MPRETAPETGFATGKVLLRFARQTFSLRPHTDYEGTLHQVRTDAELSSSNIWALMFAIVVASVGLNVNSTAVIIGAMLISPLMGPILGAGFGLATNNLELLRRSLRNLLVATTVALVVSTLYFSLSPLEEVQSELLARTRPTLYDVLIALAGGAAGAVAMSRKGLKGNAIPGVAIATALMPPLCTAGFGLAEGNFQFLFGALHLFLINALFIALATTALARWMRFPHVDSPDPAQLLRTRFVVALATLAVTLPSAYTAWSVVAESRFRQAAQRFVAENLDLPNSAVLNVEPHYSRSGSSLRVTLIGAALPETLVESLRIRLAAYGLADTRLELLQPAATAVDETMRRGVSASLLEEIYRANEKSASDREERIRLLEQELSQLRAAELPLAALTAELAALYPHLVSLGLGREARAAAPADLATPAVLVVATWKHLPPKTEQERLREFLSRRLKVEQLRMVNTR